MHETSLAAFATFAELTSVIAIAYAGLRNFRERSEVQAYVRKTFDDGLARLIKTNPRACHSDSWATLYCLGRLAELDAPAPDHPAGSDISFLRSAPYKLYSLIYASNLDKTAA